MSDDLTFFHLPLDETRLDPQDQQTYASNVGTLGGRVRVHGNPEIVYDPEVGACMQFDGQDDYVEIADTARITFTNGITVAAWVRHGEAEIADEWNVIFDMRLGDINEGKMFSLAKWSQDEQWNINVKGLSTPGPKIQKNKWQHVAATYDTKGHKTLYLDGLPVAQGDMLQADYFGGLAWNAARLGVDSGVLSSWFQGRMAHFRLYPRALSAAEIRDALRADQHSMAQARATTLLKIDLYTLRDDDHKPILYIESENRSEPLELAITNPGTKPVAFKAFTQPTEDDFQLQLRFRRNVIAPKVRKALENNPDTVTGWLTAIGTSADGREDYISFVKTSGVTAGAFDLAKGATERIQLTEFSAAAQGGARNTRIEVRFRTEAQDPGAIIRHMEVQSHLGLKTIPLIARVLGSNTLLNDGATRNQLAIQIKPTKGKDTIELNPRTRFELVVDNDLILDGQINAPKPTGLNTQPGEPGAGYTSFVFQVEAAMSIGGDTSLILEVDNWITNTSAGTCNLLLRYENIAGYWDGAWLLPVQMSPLVMQGVNVGIGTNAPKENLHVNGNALVQGRLLLGDPEKVESAKAEFAGETGILFAGDHGSDDHARIRFHSRSNQAHNLEIQVKQAGADYLVLNPEGGNVGIGTAEPQAALHVQGRIWDATGEVMPVGAIIAYAGDKAPDGWLLCAGNGCPYHTEEEKRKYGKLYEVLGSPTLFTNVNKDHFWLPDLRSRFIVGVGQGDGLSHHALRATGGEERHTLSQQEMPAHSHDFYQTLYEHNRSFAGADGGDHAVHINNPYNAAVSKQPGTKEAGAGESHNNLPPYYALTYIIKY